MEVFALTFYLCATISASGISEQKCTWKTEDYYNEKEACIEKIQGRPGNTSCRTSGIVRHEA